MPKRDADAPRKQIEPRPMPDTHALVSMDGREAEGRQPLANHPGRHDRVHLPVVRGRDLCGANHEKQLRHRKQQVSEQTQRRLQHSDQRRVQDGGHGLHAQTDDEKELSGQSAGYAMAPERVGRREVSQPQDARAQQRDQQRRRDEMRGESPPFWNFPLQQRAKADFRREAQKQHQRNVGRGEAYGPRREKPSRHPPIDEAEDAVCDRREGKRYGVQRQRKMDSENPSCTGQQR